MRKKGNTKKSIREMTPRLLLRYVHGAVDDFVKDAEQFDDLTMLCIEYRFRDAARQDDEAPTQSVDTPI